MTITPANITIDTNGNIRSNDFNDVYFMPEKGIGESKYVFIEPAKFQEKPTTVLELGFGTGLNFLLTLDQFKDKSNLHFISIEKHPIEKSDLIKIYEFLPDYLQPYCNEIIFNYPEINQGINELNIMGAKLTLYFDDVNDCINNINKNIDVIYLDGFAPSKNNDMWNEKIFSNCHKILNHNGIITTFSASSMVRENLEKNNFLVNKRTGFGNKRECIIAQKSIFRLQNEIKSVAIIGAGITGLTIANQLQQNGYDINLYDKDGIMSGASGNPYALLDPRFYDTDEGEGLFNKNAYTYATKYYAELNCFAVNGLTKHASQRIENERLQSWTSQIGKQHIETNKDSIYLPTGGAIDTEKIKTALTNNINFIQSEIIDLNTLSEDLIIICTGADTNKLTDVKYTINRGVVGITDSIGNNKCESKNGYYINTTKQCLIGSHFERVETTGIYEPTQNDKNKIIEKTNDLITINNEINLRYGYRCNTKYRIPTIQQINSKTICVCGMGSRGFINAPYTAQIISDTVRNKKLSAESSVLKLLTKTP